MSDNNKNRSLKSCSFVTYKKPHYHFNREVTGSELIEFASTVLESRAKSYGDAFTSPEAAAKFISLKLGEYEREVFAVLFLNCKNRLIKFEKMFYGTIDCASVHPREVAKKALLLNACAVIVAHNHPSGNIEPSNADQVITIKIKEALEMFEIRLLDHFIVSNGSKYTSFAHRGLI